MSQEREDELYREECLEWGNSLGRPLTVEESQACRYMARWRERETRFQEARGKEKPTSWDAWLRLSQESIDYGQPRPTPPDWAEPMDRL